jgi:hypothetical protein
MSRFSPLTGFRASRTQFVRIEELGKDVLVSVPLRGLGPVEHKMDYTIMFDLQQTYVSVPLRGLGPVERRVVDAQRYAAVGIT